MGCGCGGGGTPNVGGSASANSGNYEVLAPDGSRTFFATETAARAANARAGGRGRVSKKK